jgi:hypothetical protein
MKKITKAKIKGLQKSAKEKHQMTLARAQKTLLEMTKNVEPVTFSRFAQVAGVSPAWLYRQPAIRKKIEILREKYQNNPKPHKNRNLSEKISTESMKVQSLKQRIKSILEENKTLKKRLEVVYGDLYKLQNLKMK